MQKNSSPYHLGAIALLAQSDRVTSISVADGTIEDIVESVKLFGGTVFVTDSESDYHSIYFRSSIEKTTLWIHLHTTNLACVLQRESFQSKESVFERGTDLTIIDNQYVVLSDATK
jgi:hypothetical protein